jgi:hypothetical protein
LAQGGTSHEKIDRRLSWVKKFFPRIDTQVFSFRDHDSK